jgi:hypothetical protein
MNESKAVLLSYTRLENYRQNFSREMNTMRKDLADADAVFDRLRKVDVTPWWPVEVAAHPAVREFVRALYLSGNGAVIFGNSFVEWSASEAFRRARPSFLAAKFGVRSKPKPFTGVAVFENPELVNPLRPSTIRQGVPWTRKCWRSMFGWPPAVTRNTSNRPCAYVWQRACLKPMLSHHRDSRAGKHGSRSHLTASAMRFAPGLFNALEVN